MDFKEFPINAPEFDARFSSDSPSSKLAMKAAADNERRSMVKMLEVLFGAYGESKGIAPTPPAAPSHRRTKRVHLTAATA